MHTTPDQRQAFEVVPDPDPINPREDRENVGVMVYNSRKYVLGDERIKQESFEEYLQDAGIDKEQVISLPLYLLDHSGLALATTDFGDPWDSGCVGAIYTTLEKIEQEFGNQSEESVEKALDVLRSEVADMHAYIAGDVYGLRILENKGTSEIPQWEVVDATWGFVGSDPATNGMKDYLSEELQSLLPKKPTLRG